MDLYTFPDKITLLFYYLFHFKNRRIFLPYFVLPCTHVNFDTDIILTTLPFFEQCHIGLVGFNLLTTASIVVHSDIVLTTIHVFAKRIR
jgi:hypothetical protein